MQQEGTLLQNRMKSVQQDVQKVEQETAQAMESLLKIDTAKSRMHSVEKALRVSNHCKTRWRRNFARLHSIIDINCFKYSF